MVECENMTLLIRRSPPDMILGIALVSSLWWTPLLAALNLWLSLPEDWLLIWIFPYVID